MNNQRGPRLGWTLGGIGAFVWLIAMAAGLIAKGNLLGAAACAASFAFAVGYIFRFAPWKYEDTAFWKLYVGLFFIMVAAAVVLLAVWEPGASALKSHAYVLMYLIPGLIPAFTIGRKTWKELHGPGPDPENQ